MKKKLIFAIACIVILLVMLCIQSKPYRNARTLIDAIKSENAIQVERILESGVDPNQLTLPISRWWGLLETGPDRPLSEACGTGNFDIVKMLIEHGATAEDLDGTGWSPLKMTLFYCQPGDVEIVKLLLEHGADPQICEPDDVLVFYAAEMIPKSYDKTKSNGTVFSAEYDEKTAKDITEIVLLLLGNESVDIQTQNGVTLLMKAAESGNLNLAEYLISRGCDVNIADATGKSAYDYAAENGHQEILELLKQSID